VLSGTLAAFLLPPPLSARAAIAGNTIPPSFLSQDFLANRAAGFDPNSYRCGVQTSDIFYPPYFAGKWNATSYFVQVDAPCGPAAFGGQAVLDAALKEIKNGGAPLSYVTKFRSVGGGDGTTVIADRLYNVEQIAISSMGRNSIVDDAQPDNYNLANKLRLSISPRAAGGLTYDIDLIVTDRDQRSLRSSSSSSSSSSSVSSVPDRFDALERTLQIVSTRSNTAIVGDISPPSPSLRKEIETVTSYTRISDAKLEAIQRTATFLTPSDPRYRLAFAKNPDVEKKAVDIRIYKVIYEKI